MLCKRRKTFSMQKIKTAFVLGAGLGTRLRPLTQSTPKPMLPIRGRPLIARIFDKLADAGIERIIVNTHHAAGRYAEYFPEKTHKGVPLVFVHEEELLDTGGGLKNIVSFLDDGEALLVYNGDILFGGDMAEFLDDFETSECAASLLLRSKGDNTNVSVQDGIVCDMRGILGAPHEFKMQFCGIFAASGALLEMFERKREKVFSTVDVLVEFIERNTGSVRAFVDDESEWTDIGTIEEYMRIK
jgi:NDP-sugar pyrophosphorylase family protein